MTTKVKKKLCWNCEGRVNFHEEHCPFCGVYLSPTPLSDQEQEDDSLYSPPYSVNPENENSELPHPPYLDAETSDEENKTKEKSFPKNTTQGSFDYRSVLLPLSLLQAGSIFLLFGLILALFSRNGFFTLIWNADYWYLYLVGGVFMLLFGWKTLQYADEE